MVAWAEQYIQPAIFISTRYLASCVAPRKERPHRAVCKLPAVRTMPLRHRPCLLSLRSQLDGPLADDYTFSQALSYRRTLVQPHQQAVPRVQMFCFSAGIHTKIIRRSLPAHLHVPDNLLYIRDTAVRWQIEGEWRSRATAPGEAARCCDTHEESL